MSSLLETLREYHKTGDLGGALVILAIGVAVTVLYMLLPIIFGGYFRRLEREKTGGGKNFWGKQFWGFLVGLIYLFIGTIFLIAMFIPLAYFMLWEVGGSVLEGQWLPGYASGDNRLNSYARFYPQT